MTSRTRLVSTFSCFLTASLPTSYLQISLNEKQKTKMEKAEKDYSTHTPTTVLYYSYKSVWRQRMTSRLQGTDMRPFQTHTHNNRARPLRVTPFPYRAFPKYWIYPEGVLHSIMALLCPCVLLCFWDAWRFLFYLFPLIRSSGSSLLSSVSKSFIAFRVLIPKIYLRIIIQTIHLQ